MAALAAGRLARVSSQQLSPATGAACCAKRHNSTNLATYKRGRGGRSSFSGQVVTVLGASGFLGRYVVNKLGKIGTQVICPYRADPYDMRDLKLAGDLGQILFLPFHLEDEHSLRQVMKYSNVVINLVGRDWETRNFSFNDVNAVGAKRIARIAREMGVKRLIHMSHLNAQPNPPAHITKSGSNYLISKYYGELGVMDEFPDATIFRPSDIFGLEDRFFRYYANFWRRSLGRVPMWKKGTQTYKMPVFVSNVAEGIVTAMQDPDMAGKIVEATGPYKYQLSELVDYFYRCMRYDNMKRSWITPGFMCKVLYMSYAPTTPLVTFDMLEKECVTDTVQGYDSLLDLGVKLTTVEERAPYELKSYVANSYYEAQLGEFAAPTPPPIVT